jgi:hypothetical protein
MGIRLQDKDEAVHPAGPQSNWNESRYVDFWDPALKVGGWFRSGNRPNEGRAEMSACVYLPDGRTAFMFDRPVITGNPLTSGDLSWEIAEPWRVNRVQYRGDLLMMDDARQLSDPKRAFANSPRVKADIDLTCVSSGLETVMGKDQDHINLIFLPGQADFHYQHLIRTTGTVHVGHQNWQVNGRGGRDHSWGPRNWHAKLHMRWLIGAVDDDNGFMLTRGVGPNNATRGGYVLDRGEFFIVTDFEMKNIYGPAPLYELTLVELTMRQGGRTWTVVGRPRAWLPLRHKQTNEAGEPAILRIVKSPTDWMFDDGRKGAGMCEYHDLIVNGKPAGLHD